MSKKKSAEKKDKKKKPPPLTAFFSPKDKGVYNQLILGKNENTFKSDDFQDTGKPPGIVHRSKNTIRAKKSLGDADTSYVKIQKKSKPIPESKSLLDVINRSSTADKSEDAVDQSVPEPVIHPDTGPPTLFPESKGEPVIYIASYNYLQENFDLIFGREKEIWLLATSDTIPGHLSGELLARIDTGYQEIEAPGDLLDGAVNGSLDWVEFEREYYNALGRQYLRKPHVFRELVDISLSDEGRIILACHLAPNRQCACHILADFLYEVSSHDLGKKLTIKKLG